MKTSNTNCRKVQRDVRLVYESQRSFLIELNDISKLVFLLSTSVVIVGLFETSVAFPFFTGNRDVSYLHPMPQSMWTRNDGTAVSRDKSFTPTRQLCKPPQ